MVDIKDKPFYLNDEQAGWVEKMLKSLDIKQKAGQLFCIMGGNYREEELKKLVSEYCIGGILFRPAPAETIRTYYKRLDKIALVPLIKAANLEEGGSGAISDGTFFGWPMSVAAASESELMDKLAEICTVEGRSVGVNMTYSPVCDIDYNYRNPITNIRTCGDDPDKIRKLCSQYVKKVQAGGIAACAKHFPGDGVDFRDHHLHPTYNSLSAGKWYDTYGRIYKSLIEEGLMSIMAGHIVQPDVEMDVNPKKAYEDCMPASLSREMLTGVLREKYCFNGVITTDATIMGGYCQAMERHKAIPHSIAAGCDMLVFSTDIYEDYRYILEGLESGMLTEERLDEAVTRILALKAKFAKQDPEIRTLPETEEWCRECADKSITLVKNVQDILPITPKRFTKIRLITMGKDQIAEGSLTKLIEERLRKAGFIIERFGEEELTGTSSLKGGRLTLYLSNLETASNQTDVRIHWMKKHALDSPRFLNEEPAIFISFANPYLLQDVPRIRTYINCYSCNEYTIAAVIDKLLGYSDFKGISPVDVFCGLRDARI